LTRSAQFDVMNRQVVRGTTAVFEELFVSDDGSPIVPSDPTTYPQVTIEEPSGMVVGTGIGASLGDGRWRYQWFVPMDAELTTVSTTYSMTWTMLSATGRMIEKTLEFSIIDKIDVTENERSFTYLTLQGEEERIMIRFRFPQEELSLKIVAPDSSEMTRSITDLNVVEDQGQYVYYTDIGPLTALGAYAIFWKSRQSVISPAVLGLQQLRVPAPCFIYYAPSLRMALDKAQKKIGLAQAYSDPDMYEYMLRGVDMINSVTPVTNWNINNVPATFGLPNFMLLASMWWALGAQYIAEGELQFDYSGQQLTLSADRTGIYDTMRGNIQSYLDDHLSSTKRNWLRRQSVGAAANRPIDFGLTSLVTRVQTVNGGQQQLLPLMSRIGII